MSEPRIDSGKLEFSVEEKYTASVGSEVCRGISEFAYAAGEMLTPELPGTLVLGSTKLQREDGAISFGPQHEMGLGFRMATPLIVNGGSGRILGSHGGKDEVGNWGRPGNWWNYLGTDKGRHSGILAVAAMNNQRKVWSHARDYGFLALNPTGPPRMPKMFQVCRSQFLSTSRYK